jgi:hypothetical protein
MAATVSFKRLILRAVLQRVNALREQVGNDGYPTTGAAKRLISEEKRYIARPFQVRAFLNEMALSAQALRVNYPRYGRAGGIRGHACVTFEVYR